MKIRRRASVLLLVTLVCVVAAIGYAPTYLAYSDSPIKADAVVVFLGRDSRARFDEATKLMEEGYAHHLIVPATKEGMTTAPSNRAASYPGYFENTHIEVLEAKRAMDHSGITTAIFVSSPSHLRRIRFITEHVFGTPDLPGNQYKISFVPARSEASPALSWLWDIHRLQQMALEYTKIAWFCIYKNI